MSGWCRPMRNCSPIFLRPEHSLSNPSPWERRSLNARPISRSSTNILRNIDVSACEAAGVRVLGVRRRANIACAEHAFALMLTLARRIHRINGLNSIEQLSAANLPYKPFDRRHVPGGNWGRIEGMRSLNGSTIGIIGLGEIGREIALRAAAFGMNVVYFQRTRLLPSEEETLRVSYRPLDILFAVSDWVIPQLPGDP